MSDWHPILAAVEVEPGDWRMVAQYDDCYGAIRFLARERRYQATTWAEQPEGRKLVGYFITLKASVEATHHLFVRSHGVGPDIGYPAYYPPE
jgi:hypothetical protein